MEVASCSTDNSPQGNKYVLNQTTSARGSKN